MPSDIVPTQVVNERKKDVWLAHIAQGTVGGRWKKQQWQHMISSFCLSILR
jgi:hypothetical protein